MHPQLLAIFALLAFCSFLLAQQKADAEPGHERVQEKIAQLREQLGIAEPARPEQPTEEEIAERIRRMEEQRKRRQLGLLKQDWGRVWKERAQAVWRDPEARELPQQLVQRIESLIGRVERLDPNVAQKLRGNLQALQQRLAARAQAPAEPPPAPEVNVEAHIEEQLQAMRDANTATNLFQIYRETEQFIRQNMDQEAAAARVAQLQQTLRPIRKALYDSVYQRRWQKQWSIATNPFQPTLAKRQALEELRRLVPEIKILNPRVGAQHEQQLERISQ